MTIFGKEMPTPVMKPTECLPVAGVVALTQTAVGCGIGLLVAARMSRTAQKTTAIAMLSLGLLSSAPLVFEAFLKRWNRPESERRMRKRLESIRDDHGFPEDAEVF